MATSQVTNKIKLIGRESDASLEQKFTMTSDNRSLMTFSVASANIGNIVKNAEGMFLNLNENIVKNLPEDIKSKIVMLGTASMKIQPLESGVCPIEIDARNNELKVQIKAKDGSKVYECRINATGVYLKYDGHESSYTPESVEGKSQAIDVTMSTECFAKMIDKNNTDIKLANASKTENLTPRQIPDFMLGTFLEASAPVEKEILTKEREMDGVLSSFTLSLPNGESKSDYHFVKNSKGQAYAFHNGTLKPVHSFAIIATKNTDGTLKEPYLSINIGTKAEPVYAYIDLPTETKDGKQYVDAKVLDAVKNLNTFTGVGVSPRETGDDGIVLNETYTDEKFQKAESANSENERAFSTKVKGKSFTFNLTVESETEDHAFAAEPPADEVEPTDTGDSPAGTPPVETDEHADEIEETPAPTESGSKLLAKEKPFTSTPMKSVDMSKVKSKISPDWGVNMMLIGMIFMIVGLLLGPALAAVFACVGVAVTAGGAWLAVNADRLANPYLKLEQYIIDPLKKKERQLEKEQEAFWENTKELNGARAKAKETKEELLNTEESAEAAYWKEIFGDNYEEFLSDDNLLRRQDFLKDLALINAKTGDEKERMKNEFQSRYGLLSEAVDNLFNEESKEIREKSLAAMRTLNSQQEIAHEKQAEQADKLKKANELLYKKLLQNDLSPEAKKEFVEQNKHALAMHILSQNNLSQAETEKLLEILPDNCREIIKSTITEIAEAPKEMDKIVHESALRAQEHQKTLDYAETIKEIEEKERKGIAFVSPTNVGEATVDFIISNTVSNAKDLQEIKKMTFDDTSLARTIEDSLITLNAKDTTPDSLGDLLKKQQSLLTTKIGTRKIGEKVLEEGVGDELSGKLGMTMVMEYLDPASADEYVSLDLEISQKIVKSLDLTKLTSLVSDKTLDDATRNEFRSNEALVAFSDEQKDALALLSLYPEEPALKKVVELALDERLLPALKARYVMTADDINEDQITVAALQAKAVKVNKTTEQCKQTEATIQRFNSEERAAIHAKAPNSYAELKSTAKDVVGAKERAHVDGKTVSEAVDKGLVVPQEKIGIANDTKFKQQKYAIERKLGKEQTDVIQEESIKAVKEKNNIEKVEDLGKIKEIEQGTTITDDVTAKESKSSTRFHKTEAKYDARRKDREEALEVLTEILAMPDDTGEEKVNALTEYLSSFEVGEKQPFEMPNTGAKGFSMDKWIKETVEKVAKQEEIDKKDYITMVENLTPFQRKTSDTVKATKLAMNAKTFDKAYEKVAPTITETESDTPPAVVTPEVTVEETTES